MQFSLSHIFWEVNCPNKIREQSLLIQAWKGGGTWWWQKLHPCFKRNEIRKALESLKDVSWITRFPCQRRTRQKRFNCSPVRQTLLYSMRFWKGLKAVKNVKALGPGYCTQKEKQEIDKWWGASMLGCWWHAQEQQRNWLERAEWGLEDKLEMWIEVMLGVIFTPKPKAVDSRHLILGNYGEIYIKEQKKIKVIFLLTRFFVLWILRYLHLPDKEGSPAGFLLLRQSPSRVGSFPCWLFELSWCKVQRQERLGRVSESRAGGWGSSEAKEHRRSSRKWQEWGIDK